MGKDGRFEVGNTAGKGGKPGNDNALRHGVHACLRTGNMPKGREWTKRQQRALANLVADAISQTHGQISLTHGCVLQSFARVDGAIRLLEDYRRDNPSLPLADQLAIADRIVKFSEARQKFIDRLDLDRETKDDISKLLGADVLDALRTSDDRHDQSATPTDDVSTGLVDAQNANEVNP